MSERAPTKLRHRLIEIVARQMARRFGGSVSVDELYDLGVPGLATAQNIWDGRGRFEAFAMERIRWAAIDGLRKRKREARTMAAAAAELAAEQFAPAVEELTDSGVDVQRVAEEDIDQLLDAGAANFAIDLDGVGGVEQDATRLQVRRAITELPPQQSFVMERYVYFGDTFEEVGKSLGMTAVAACKIHAKALLTLRRRLEPSRLATASDD